MISHLVKPSCLRRFFSHGNNETRPIWPLIRIKKHDIIAPCKAVSYGATKGRFLKASYYKLFRRHRDFFFMCRQKRRGGGVWGSYMKWDLQISTKPVMGSCGWRGHWGAVDFPSWDRDIITLRVATQKSPSSVPRLVSANYKTQWMTFTQGKENLCCFLSFGCKVIHRGIILVQGLFCHPLITTCNCKH